MSRCQPNIINFLNVPFYRCYFQTASLAEWSVGQLSSARQLQKSSWPGAVRLSFHFLNLYIHISECDLMELLKSGTHLYSGNCGQWSQQMLGSHLSVCVIFILVIMSVLHTFFYSCQLILTNKFTVSDVNTPDHKHLLIRGSSHFMFDIV